MTDILDPTRRDYDRDSDPDPNRDRDEGRMTIIEHLTELRNRLVVSIIALVVGMVIAFAFSGQLFDFLRAPLQGKFQIQQIEPTESISAYLQITFLAGFIISLPMHIYQIVMFVAPGLLPHEKRLLYLFLPFTLIAFVAGVAFGYYVLLPPALSFLLGFGADIGVVDKTELRVSAYYDLIIRLMFWIGVTFLTPVFMLILGRLGILTYQRVAPFRRYAIVIAFILGAIITPTIDPLNLSLVAIPLIVLFEVGLQLVRFFGKKPEPATV